MPRTEVDWALKQLDIDWRDGGAYALLGPSGCGKTTTSMAILRLIKSPGSIETGQIMFDGMNLLELDDEEMTIDFHRWKNDRERRRGEQCFAIKVELTVLRKE